jgi:hypothetical protein
MIRRYPEWFIGGPWHGRDKTIVCPHLQSMVRVASVNEGSDAESITEEYVYTPRNADVFGEPVTVWVGDHENPHPYVNGEPSEWVQLFGQLLMSPHRKDTTTPFNVAPYAAIHRDRWEIEREIRNELTVRFGAELHQLRNRVRFLSRTARPRNPEVSGLGVENEDGDACVLQVKLGHKVTSVRFDHVVLYEDPGTDEHPAGWVATGQAPARSELGDASWDEKSFTGYAPDKTGAVVALIADRLGYYARLTTYESKGRNT